LACIPAIIDLFRLDGKLRFESTEPLIDAAFLPHRHHAHHRAIRVMHRPAHHGAIAASHHLGRCR
jgi:hypothetical protein